MRVILVFVLLSSVLQSFAFRAPGYQGKHFNVFISTAGKLDMVRSEFSIAHFPLELGVEFAQTQQRTLTLSYERFSFDRFLSFTELENRNGGITEIDYLASTEISVQSIRFKLRAYFRNTGYIAPLGRYYEVGLAYHMLNRKVFEYDSPATNPLLNDFGDKRASDLAVTIAGGKQWVFAGRLTLDLGLQVGLPIFSLYDLYRYEIEEETESPVNNTGSSYTEDDVEAQHQHNLKYDLPRRHLLGNTVLQFKIRIGFLAF